MKKTMLLVLLASLAFTGCGPGFQVKTFDPPPVGVPDPYDDGIVVGRATINIVDGKVVAFNRKKPFNIADLLIPKAYAYNGSTPPSASVVITYTNAANSDFELTSGAIPNSPTFSPDGLTLDFGSVSIGDLDDNALRRCTSTVGSEPSSGNQKCNNAIIRVYALTGQSDGVFCNNDVDYGGYCVPMKVNGVAFGVGVANAQNVLTYAIPNNVNRLRKSNLTPTSWPLVVDMSNAGEGSYSATVVVEYVLKR